MGNLKRKEKQLIREKYAEGLKTMMQRNGLKNAELAELIGTSEASVSKWLNAINLPREKRMKQLEDLFGVKIEEICEGVGDMVKRETTLYKNASGCSDPTAYKAIQNCIGGVRLQVCRGDIFYVKKSGFYTGSEQEEGRPAIIVSNDACNKFSSNVTVVYLTTQEKKPLPTHVAVVCKEKSTALCECVNTVSKERLYDYVRTCSEDEMAAIDKALMIQLGLDLPVVTGVTAVERIKEQEIDDLQMKLEGAERELDEVRKIANDLNDENARLKCKELVKPSDDYIKILAERNLYKSLYEQTFERLIG